MLIKFSFKAVFGKYPGGLKVTPNYATTPHPQCQPFPKDRLTV